MSSLMQRYRFWLGADRVTKVRLANSSVMGQTPVLVLSIGMALAGMSQLAGELPSHVVLAYGGERLNIVWSVCMILSALLTVTARVLADRMDSAAMEIGGIAAIDFTLLTYLFAIYHASQFDGAFFTLALGGTTIINCTGRAVLLYRRSRDLRRALT